MKRSTFISGVIGLTVGLTLACTLLPRLRRGLMRSGGLVQAPLADDDPAQPLVATVKQWRGGAPTDAGLDQFRRQWPPTQLHPLLRHEHEQVRRSAVLALAYVGDHASIDPLIERLRDTSAIVRRLADEALWRVWFHLGSAQANLLVARAIKYTQAGAADMALPLLAAAIADSPDFAEAYNQRAILYFLHGAYADSAKDCLRTLNRMPEHYGALTGLGRCLMNLGRDAEALKTFQEAKMINPNLPLQPLIEGLKARVGENLAV